MHIIGAIAADANCHSVAVLPEEFAPHIIYQRPVRLKIMQNFETGPSELLRKVGYALNGRFIVSCAQDKRLSRMPTNNQPVTQVSARQNLRKVYRELGEFDLALGFSSFFREVAILTIQIAKRSSLDNDKLNRIELLRKFRRVLIHRLRKPETIAGGEERSSMRG
jgi:hypothetical protein